MLRVSMVKILGIRIHCEIDFFSGALLGSCMPSMAKNLKVEMACDVPAS